MTRLRVTGRRGNVRAMIRALCLLVAGGACAVGSATPIAENVIPPAWPATRYEGLIAKSPFAPATPAAAPAAPGFAANLFVTGIAKIADKDFVMISSRDQQTKLSLYGDQPSGDISLVSVQWSEQIGKTKVTIKKGQDFATLEFDQAAVQKPVQVTNTQPVVPGQGPMRPPGPVPGPRIIQNIPQGASGGVTPEPRRRRIINSKP